MSDTAEWGRCEYCATRYRKDLATFSYWSPDGRGDGLEFCTDLCREMHKSEPRRIYSGHEMTLADALLEVARLRQGYWEARAIMGFDNDGDSTPAAFASDFVALMLDDARSMRADYDEALEHVPLPYDVTDAGRAHLKGREHGD